MSMDQLSPNPIAALRDRFRILSQLLALSGDERALWLASQFIIEGASVQEWTDRSGLSSPQTNDYLQHRLVAATWTDGRETERKTLWQALKDWTDELDQHFRIQDLNICEESYDDIIPKITSKGVELPNLEYDDMERWYLSIRAIMDTFDHINLPPMAQPPAYYERNAEYPPDQSYPTRLTTSRTTIKKAPIIRLLYDANLDAISTAASYLTHDVKRTKELATRVKIWGMDLFTGLLPLDELLNPNLENVPFNQPPKKGENFSLLRYNVVGVWADIAATLEHLLRCLIGQENSRLQSSWNSLFITLSLDEIAEAVFDEPELLREQPMIPVYDIDIIELCIGRLEGFVNCLFDLLVNIGTLRQVRLSNLQEELSLERHGLSTTLASHQGHQIIRTNSLSEPQMSAVDSGITAANIETLNPDEKHPITNPLTPLSDRSTKSIESDLKEHLSAINYQAVQPTIRDWDERSKDSNWSKTSGSWVFQRNEVIPWHSPPAVDYSLPGFSSLHSELENRHPMKSPDPPSDVSHETTRPTPDHV